ncbi:MAG TPA: DUF6585 family protein [Urbifossiella sp.]|jgi:hypothetical protein|nr:DUF6585 family protein [Urbifossiella sp.]
MPELPAETRVFPWATDDAVVSAHRWSLLRWAGSIWPFFAAMTFWAALVGNMLVAPPAHLTPDKLAVLTFGILAIILALFGFVLYMAAWRLLNRTRTLFLFEDGFVYRDTAGEWGGCRWADVIEVWRAETVTHGLTTRSHVRLVTPDADLLLDRALNGYDKLAGEVQTRAARATLPDLLARYRRGERLDFGPVALDSAGVTLRGREVAWAEMKEFRLLDGALLLVGPPIDVWRGNGVRLRDVPNVAALLALLNIPPWAALKPA